MPPIDSPHQWLFSISSSSRIASTSWPNRSMEYGPGGTLDLPWPRRSYRMTRNSLVSAAICGSHISSVQPSEFDSISVGPLSRPSMDTLSRHPSPASIMGIVFPSDLSASYAGLTPSFLRKNLLFEEDGLPGPAMTDGM